MIKSVGLPVLYAPTLAPPRRRVLCHFQWVLPMNVVYALRSLRTGRVYIGHSSNVERRLNLHNSGFVRSTKLDRPWKIIASEKFSNRETARWRERELKRSCGRRMKWLRENMWS